MARAADIFVIAGMIGDGWFSSTGCGMFKLEGFEDSVLGGVFVKLRNCNRLVGARCCR
jgi:hypothetical protein